MLTSFVCSQQSAPLPICGECLGTAAKNRLGRAEPLSSCSECGSSVHLSCVGGGRGVELAALLAKGGRWFCEECRTCAGCNETADQASVVTMFILIWLVSCCIELIVIVSFYEGVSRSFQTACLE
jgi:hypothetical protein